ncbi:DUF308 domain-containing protein [Sphingomonas sp. PR090111-T3T-6A]|uniref:DUF308 domain-containing protein n=1 Tax=Sphingomonas sp. PR090111-T3T-6A TaxID=685778 RepID=UPI00036CFA40|nr:DUF308 domain-containing protein [Sphingomonas sp. PR090111-T3T-6A]
MISNTIDNRLAEATAKWLKGYYFTRFAFSAIWVAVAFTVAKNAAPLAAVMLIAYPVWDALANFVDAQRSGGIAHNKSQLLNFIVSIITAIAVGVALDDSMNSVLFVFGVWAGFAGIFQLATAVGRWKSYGAQWAMALSGAQSALAGIFMVKMAHGPAPVGIANVAPYAAFGAFYFLVSAIWLTVSEARKVTPRAAH